MDEEIALQERPSPPGEALPPTGAEPFSPAAEPLVEKASAEEQETPAEEDWPIEVKGRIPSGDLFVQTEELKSTKGGKVITTSKEEGQTITHTEVPVKEFKRLLMRRFNEADAKAEGLIFDQIQRARITDFAGVVDYFSELLTAEEKKLVGRWSGSNTDPDNPGRWEFIRRPDRTGTIAYANEGDKPEEITLGHGFWKLRHGKFILSELTEGKKVMPWGEISLWDEFVIQVADDQFVTEWIDPERRVLGGLLARECAAPRNACRNSSCHP